MIKATSQSLPLEKPCFATPIAAESLKLSSWDPAVFATDVLRSQNAQQTDFEQTSKGLSVAYNKIMTTIQSYFDIAEFEPSMAPDRQLDEKKKLYQFSTENGYPPHLDLVPERDALTDKQIFRYNDDGEAMFGVVFRSILMKKSRIGAALFDFVRPGPTDVNGFRSSGSFKELMANHRESRQRAAKGGSMSKPSIGDIDDSTVHWYSDAMFAQQAFNGTNPNSIKLAGKWTQRFRLEASRQKLESVGELLDQAEPSSLYVLDCSYFREAFGIDEQAIMSDEGGFLTGTSRWACAAVTLFQLGPKGILHPLAIVIDYKGSMENSTIIFNQRLTSDDTSHDQENDWPWRYAKTCAQVSDWIRHELAIHLTDTHLMEEPIIVASQRTLPSSHIIYKILSPHWDKTLSLNASARATLVPKVIIPIIGTTTEQCMNFINYSYKNFDFQGRYIPNDLENRGFPLDLLGDLCCRCPKACDVTKDPNEPCTVGCPSTCHQKCDPRYTNYTYARNMKLMWKTLHTFVAGYLASQGLTNDPNGNTKLQKDTYISSSWSEEIRSAKGANIPSFPEINTVADLIDAVTMCIHIASPQHTAVNYLQQYYLSFVPNKPPALYTAPPTTLSTLTSYTETNLIDSLPVARNRDAEWLLASNLPALLSQTVSKDLNLVAYAVNVYSAARLVNDKALMDVAERLCRELWVLGNTFAVGDVGRERQVKKGVFTVHGEELAAGFPRYEVLDPVVTAVSVLI